MPLPFIADVLWDAALVAFDGGATGFFEGFRGVTAAFFFGDVACTFFGGVAIAFFFLGVGATTFLGVAFFAGATGFFVDIFFTGTFFLGEGFALGITLTLGDAFLGTTGFFFATFTATFFIDEALPETGFFAPGLAVVFVLFCFVFADIRYSLPKN